jgi:hypothetical protein
VADESNPGEREWSSKYDESLNLGTLQYIGRPRDRLPVRPEMEGLPYRLEWEYSDAAPYVYLFQVSHCARNMMDP